MKRNCFVCAIYTPPSKNIAVFLEELARFLKRYAVNERVILAGDLNIYIPVTNKVGVSEYLALLASFGLENKIQGYTREEFLGSKFTQTYITQTCKLYDWNTLLQQNYLYSYKLLVEQLQSIYNKSKTKVKLKRRNRASPWINKEIIELSYIKSKLLRRCNERPHDFVLREEFRQLRNKITAKIRLAKKHYQLNIFSACSRDVKKHGN